MEIRKFSQEVKKELGYYVYIYKDEDGRVTYVGMGQNDRVLAHRKGEAFILAYGMDKEQALAIEAVLIDLLKAMPDVPPKLTNKRRGDKNRIGCKIGMFPVSEIEEQLKNTHYALVLNVSKSYRNGISLYEAVKGDWPVDQSKAERADFVLAEKDGRIIGVFKASSWHQCKGNKGKYYFDGTEDVRPEIRERWIGYNVRRQRGEATPVRYLYFDPDA